MTLTSHGAKRAQQRAIPPVVHQWLDEFGEEEFDGCGGIRRYFSHRSMRAMEQRYGRHFVRENRKYLAAYLVESTDDHRIITAGWRYRRINRH
jgi:hypothetical protein